MSDAKRTLGPWKVVRNSRNCTLNVVSAPDADGESVKIALVNYQDEANANLIAAAPDMRDEITRLRAELEALGASLRREAKYRSIAEGQAETAEAERDALLAERDAAERSAYEDAARFIEENVFNYSSGDQNYWSHRKGDNTHGLEYAREFREKAAAIRSEK